LNLCKSNLNDSDLLKRLTYIEHSHTVDSNNSLKWRRRRCHARANKNRSLLCYMFVPPLCGTCTSEVRLCRSCEVFVLVWTSVFGYWSRKLTSQHYQVIFVF